MEFLKQTRFIERLQFFNGQRLFAPDLNGLEAFNREMRELHNISLHQPGIGNGFAVSGKKGEREVGIGPGYAIDGLGREIVLLTDLVEPVPPVAGQKDGSPRFYYLTVSYPDDADLEETEMREGICDTRGAIRLREEPVFCWVELSDGGQPKDPRLNQEILKGMKLVLAQAEVLNCQLSKDLSISQRLSARPPKQPYICCGETTADWEPWIVAPLDTYKDLKEEEKTKLATSMAQSIMFAPVILPIGLTVDVSECDFVTRPCTSIRIAGPRIIQLTRTVKPASPPAEPHTFNFLVDGLVQITDTPSKKPNKFTVSVLLMAQVLLGSPRDIHLIEDLVLEVIEFFWDPKTDPKSEQFKKQVKDFLDQFFLYKRDERTGKESGWKLVWMGVEG